MAGTGRCLLPFDNWQPHRERSILSWLIRSSAMACVLLLFISYILCLACCTVSAKAQMIVWFFSNMYWKILDFSNSPWLILFLFSIILNFSHLPFCPIYCSDTHIRVEFCINCFLEMTDFCSLVLDRIFLEHVVRFEDGFCVTIASSSEVLESVSNEWDDNVSVNFFWCCISFSCGALTDDQDSNITNAHIYHSEGCFLLWPLCPSDYTGNCSMISNVTTSFMTWICWCWFLVSHSN